MKVAIVIYGEILAPVVRSQTFPLMRHLVTRGHEVLLVAITSKRRLLSPGRWRPVLGEGRDAAGGRIAVLSHAPRHRSFDRVARRLRRILDRFGPDVVHARQCRAGVVAARADAAPVLLDMRGIRPEEYLLSLGRAEERLAPGEALELSRLRDQEQEARAAASATVCVSGPFREHLGGDRVFVVPNAADPIPAPDAEERKARRREYGIGPEDVAFVYSGSLAAWQCPEAAVRLFRDLARKRDGMRLVLLTHDLSGGKALAPPGAVVASLTPEETRRELPLFDVAFLLREDSIVNRVAAPVKFVEYLHGGLAVVLTEGIGDASRLVRAHDLGVVLDSPVDDGNAGIVLYALDGLDGERGRAYARESLTFDVTTTAYEDAYRLASGGAS